MQDDTKFHLSEGMNFALEGMKTLFILNGASAISVLTFVGNTKSKSAYLIMSMSSFGLGALFAAISMAMAYITQLQYGGETTIAKGVHVSTYVIVVAGIIAFIVLWPTDTMKP